MDKFSDLCRHTEKRASTQPHLNFILHSAMNWYSFKSLKTHFTNCSMLTRQWASAIFKLVSHCLTRFMLLGMKWISLKSDEVRHFHLRSVLLQIYGQLQPAIFTCRARYIIPPACSGSTTWDSCQSDKPETKHLHWEAPGRHRNQMPTKPQLTPFRGEALLRAPSGRLSSSPYR